MAWQTRSATTGRRIRSGAPRAGLISFVVLAIMALNVRGIKQSSLAVNLLTIGKLTPLAIFIIVGLPSDFVRGDTAGQRFRNVDQLSASALPLIFAFGGYEVIPVPAGEARDPKRGVPFAMIAAILIVAILMTLAQIVALGTLPGPRDVATNPARRFLDAADGRMGRAHDDGRNVDLRGRQQCRRGLSGSRSLFALAEQHDIPRIVRADPFPLQDTRCRDRVHVPFDTCACAVGIVRFARGRQRGRASLVIYSGTCASVLMLRRSGQGAVHDSRRTDRAGVGAGRVRDDPVGCDSAQLQAGGQALLAGAVLFFMARMGR